MPGSAPTRPEPHEHGGGRSVPILLLRRASHVSGRRHTADAATSVSRGNAWASEVAALRLGADEANPADAVEAEVGGDRRIATGTTSHGTERRR